VWSLELIWTQWEEKEWLPLMVTEPGLSTYRYSLPIDFMTNTNTLFDVTGLFQEYNQ
jgi:hypothetical protein